MATFQTIFTETPKRETTQSHPKLMITWVHYEKLFPSKFQYRDIPREKVVDLAELIKTSGEVLQPLLIRREGPDRYEILSGHTRHLACRYLAEEQGLTGFAFLPCYVKSMGDVRAEFAVYATNDYSKTPYEQMVEIEGMKRLMEEHPGEFPELSDGGRIIEHLAKRLHLARSVVSDYQNISHNLSDAGTKAFASGRIGKSAAVSLAGLPKEEQDVLLKKGTATHKEIQQYKKDKAVPKFGTTEPEADKAKISFHSAQCLVEQYCSHFPSAKQAFLKICNQHGMNAKRAKAIQEYVSPCGCGGNVCGGDYNFLYDFYKVGKGICFVENEQETRLSYIQFVKILEQLYGPWQTEAESPEAENKSEGSKWDAAMILSILNKEKASLKNMLDIETAEPGLPVKMVERQKIIVAALEVFLAHEEAMI